MIMLHDHHHCCFFFFTSTIHIYFAQLVYTTLIKVSRQAPPSASVNLRRDLVSRWWEGPQSCVNQERKVVGMKISASCCVVNYLCGKLGQTQ